MAPFHGTENKDVVRRVWDRPILRKRVETAGRRIHYLGLPGGDIDDLLDWRELLDYRTGVQRVRTGRQDKYQEDQLTVHNILAKLSTRYGSDGNSLAERFELRRGQIEDLIVNGRDQDNVPPYLAYGKKREKFRYDLYNLDFEGGWFLDEARDAKRSQMLTELFVRQAGTDFTLMLTLGVRNTADSWMIDYVRARVGEAPGNEGDSILNWLSRLGPGRIFVWSLFGFPLFVKREAEHGKFSCQCYPPLTYVGTGSTRMLHFVFDLSYSPTPFHAVSQATDTDILSMPSVEVTSSLLKLFEEQSPCVSALVCSDQLGFLPDEVSVPVVAEMRARIENKSEVG